MARQYRLKKTPRIPSAKEGYYLDAVYEGGFVFDHYPEFVMHELNLDSSTYQYTIEPVEEEDGNRKTPTPMGTGNYGTPHQGTTPTKVNGSTGAFAGLR